MANGRGVLRSCFSGGGGQPQTHLYLVLLGLAMLTASALGQSRSPKPGDPAAPQATSSSSEQSEVPEVPGLSAALHGVNAGITMSSLHDSITGWATVATPAIGYSFNDHFNFDVLVPIYLYRLAESRSANPRPNAQLVIQRAEVGDVVLGLHASFYPRFADYQLTGSVAAPTGDAYYGLTSGRVTFDVTNHLERSFGRWTPTVEVGMGDSSTLTNRLVTKDYTSLGPLAHFAAGASVELVRNISFESVAYEQLPVGDQKTYGPARKGGGTVVTGHNISEDNGFTNSLDIPLDRHTTLSAYYNRSLRFHTDTAAVGLTFVLRPARPAEPLDSLDDLLK